MVDLAQNVLAAARRIQSEVPKKGRPPDAPHEPDSEQVLPNSLFLNTRGYIELIVYQINGCYENGWFDACAVMMRRLLETLIIEAFEHHQLAGKIQDTQGDFLYLSELINITLRETSWNLTRNAKRAFARLKDIGDKSAHSRRYNAHRADIEKVIPDVRLVSQELLYLAGLI